MWIALEDKKPRVNENVLLIDNNDCRQYVGWIDMKNQFYCWSRKGRARKLKIEFTHWMELENIDPDGYGIA